MAVLIIDNYDSFTYNLAHYVCEFGKEVGIYYNDQVTIENIIAEKPSHIIISPGPGRPEQTGIVIPLIQAVRGKIPILGVCLGHQAIGASAGAKIVQANKIMHGKTSFIQHTKDHLFTGIPLPFKAMRYHSLVIRKNSLPKDFTITAWTQGPDGGVEEIMAIQHKTELLFGVQFHPESIATDAGDKLIENFLRC